MAITTRKINEAWREVMLTGKAKAVKGTNFTHCGKITFCDTMRFDAIEDMVGAVDACREAYVHSIRYMALSKSYELVGLIA